MKETCQGAASSRMQRACGESNYFLSIKDPLEEAEGC